MHGQLAARLPRRELIDALERAFRAGYEVPSRQHHALGDAWRRSCRPGAADHAGVARRGALGVKLVTVFADNAARAMSAVHASYTLFDAQHRRASRDDGRLRADPPAHRGRLGARRALPCRCDASRLLMVGTGGLAPHIIDSHAVVRPIREVRIWGRTRCSTRAIWPQRLRARAAYSVEATEDLEAAVRWADIVSCATLANSPLIWGAWLRAGQHLDLVGSFRPDMREADEEALLVADIYVDTRDGALQESGELVRAIASGAITSADIRGELSGPGAVRPPAG